MGEGSVSCETLPYPFIGLWTHRSENSHFSTSDQFIQNVILTNSDFAIVICVLVYNHLLLGTSRSAGWLESYDASRKRRSQDFLCQSQMHKNGENGYTVHLQPTSHTRHINIIKDNETDLIELQSLSNSR